MYIIFIIVVTVIDIVYCECYAFLIVNRLNNKDLMFFLH